MFDFSKIEIKLIPNNEAKQFMQKYHYTKSCPKSTYALGFYYNNQFCILYRKKAPNYGAFCLTSHL